jgi:hypothetical protein
MNTTHPLPLIYLTLLAISLALSPDAALRAQDTPKGNTDEIHELAQVSAELPHDVLIGFMNSAARSAAATKGTDALRQKVEGRMATFKFKVDKIEKDDRRGQDEPYRIKAEDAHVRQGAVGFRVYLWVHFNISENAKIAALKKGDEVSATGKVAVASVGAPNIGPTMNVSLADATLK